jgi:hypothetical protein
MHVRALITIRKADSAAARGAVRAMAARGTAIRGWAGFK